MRSTRAISPSGPSASGSAPSGTRCSSEPGTNDAGAQRVVVGRAEEGAEGMITRRDLLGGLAATGGMGLLGLDARPAAAEPPPETTRIRLSKVPSVCVAPQYVAEEFLTAEGFTDVRYVGEKGAGVG